MKTAQFAALSARQQEDISHGAIAYRVGVREEG
jgi:hypothetical protein